MPKYNIILPARNNLHFHFDCIWSLHLIVIMRNPFRNLDTGNIEDSCYNLEKVDVVGRKLHSCWTDLYKSQIFHKVTKYKTVGVDYTDKLLTIVLLSSLTWAPSVLRNLTAMVDKLIDDLYLLMLYSHLDVRICFCSHAHGFRFSHIDL